LRGISTSIGLGLRLSNLNGYTLLCWQWHVCSCYCRTA